ncbi:MAG: hypothetical protein IJN52_06240 [Bacteroidales bacterium]|nr:hypothetical protein [Bacteroidales bacterium]
MIHLLVSISVISMVATSCIDKTDVEVEEYLDVNANNISGKWELAEWNGSALTAGTYVFMEIVRNDRTFTLYQNLDSFNDVPHVVTGSYFIETDPELGAIIRGSYDHDSGDWAHRYIIRDLTRESMIWVAKDNPEFVQKFVRVESIPVE